MNLPRIPSLSALRRLAPAGLVVLVLALSACSPTVTAAQLPAATLTVVLPVTGATAAPTATAQVATAGPVGKASGPKAYIGLFKDNAVAVMDTATNQVLGKIPIPAGPHGLVITPDGKKVFASSDGDSKVSVIDTASDKVVDTIEVGKTPHGLALTPDGSTLLVADFGTNQVIKIDAQTDQFIDQAAVPSPHNIAVSPDGQTAYVASQPASSPALVILKLSPLAQTGKVALPKVPRALGFSPDGKELYFTEAGVDAVQVLDPATNKITTQIPVGASPHLPLFTPDGKLGLVVSQGPGQLSILDPKTNTVNKVVSVGKMPHWIAVQPQGTTAWVTNEASNDLSVVDLATGTVTATIAVGSAPRKIVVQPAAAAAQGSGAAVAIGGMAFSPASLTVKVNQAVTWTNNDSIAHTVTADKGLWDSGDIDPGKSYTFMPTLAGTFGYHCSNHPFMTGTLIVTQ